jgi:hypothetical protein
MGLGRITAGVRSLAAGSRDAPAAGEALAALAAERDFFKRLAVMLLHRTYGGRAWFTADELAGEGDLARWDISAAAGPGGMEAAVARRPARDGG